MTEPVKLDLHAVIARAKEMAKADRLAMGDGVHWAYLKEWQKLSWFMEAADDLGMEL